MNEQGAMIAATELASSFGLNGCAPVILQSSNNVVVRLDPYPVVVKVAGRAEKHDALQIELAVALHLAEKHAPTVRPAAAVAAIVHENQERAMTFWDLVPIDEGRAPDGQIGTGIARIHRDLQDFDGELPSWRAYLLEVIIRLHDPSFPAPEAEAKTLREACRRIEDAVTNVDVVREQPLLGEPHLNNVFAGPIGWVFADFEAACIGPSEADLAYLPSKVIKTYGPYDEELRELFVRVTNLRVAAWCWIGATRSPELRPHAEHHTHELGQWLGRR
jgi:Ser/Thr protein kinase RdoA (MazF antagonist)